MSTGTSRTDGPCHSAAMAHVGTPHASPLLRSHFIPRTPRLEQKRGRSLGSRRVRPLRALPQGPKMRRARSKPTAVTPQPQGLVTSAACRARQDRGSQRCWNPAVSPLRQPGGERALLSALRLCPGPRGFLLLLRLCSSKPRRVPGWPRRPAGTRPAAAGARRVGGGTRPWLWGSCVLLSAPAAGAVRTQRGCSQPVPVPRGYGGRSPALGRVAGTPPIIKSRSPERSASRSRLSLVYLRGLLFFVEQFVHVLCRSAEAGWAGFEPESGKRRKLHPEPDCSKKSKFGYYSSPRGKSYLLQIFDTGTSPIINKNNQTISLPSWGFKKSSSAIHEHYNLFFFFSPCLDMLLYMIFSVCVRVPK